MVLGTEMCVAVELSCAGAGVKRLDDVELEIPGQSISYLYPLFKTLNGGIRWF